MGACKCDGYLARSGNQCVDVSKAVGAPCTSQKECWKRQARCKGPEGRRTCQCQGTYSLNTKTASCVDKRDIVSETIGLDRMFRVPRYNDINPGRRLPVNKSHHTPSLPYNNREDGFLPHCSLGRTINGDSQPVKWPIIWKEHGFLVGGFFKSQADNPGGMSLSFYNGGSIGQATPAFMMEFGPEILLKEGESVKRSGGLVAKKGDIIWFFLQYSCPLTMLGCQIKVGMGQGLESRLAQFEARYQHMASLAGPGITAYSLTSQGGGQLEVAVECLGGPGAACSHPAQCTSGVCQPSQTPACA